MSLLKHQLPAALKRKCLNLNEKIAILIKQMTNLSWLSKISWTPIQISIKTAISEFLKDSSNLRRDNEIFQETYKKRHHGKYHVINEVLYK